MTARPVVRVVAWSLGFFKEMNKNNRKDRTRNGLLGILNLSLILGCGCGTAEGPQIQEGHSPTVATGKASSLGTRAFSPNGTIHPKGQPTTYFFEYGTGKEYGRRTEERPLAPRLAAHYRETWDEGLGGWWTWLEAKHVSSGGVDGGHVSYSEPSRHDHNHDDGIGTLHLIQSLLCGIHWTVGDCDPSQGPCLAAGDPDLRDAQVTVSVRGHDWEPNGSEVTLVERVLCQHRDDRRSRVEGCQLGLHGIPPYRLPDGWTVAHGEVSPLE